MGNYKDDKGKTRVGNILKSISSAFPDLLEITIEAATSANPIGVLGGAVKDAIKKKLGSDIPKERMSAQDILEQIDHELKAFELEIKDRERATSLYKVDSSIQKIFAIVFLVGYILMTGVMFYGAYKIAIEGVKLDNYLVSLITAVFTAMSGKVNTITDFLFGGSFK